MVFRDVTEDGTVRVTGKPVPVGGSEPTIASVVSYNGSAGLSSTNVEAALDELDTEKAPISHSHAIGNVTGLQAALDGKAAVGHNHDGSYAVIGHLHDDRYFTEAEVTALLAGKSDTSHTHDSRYYTETEVDTLLTGKSSTGHSHIISNVTGLQTALDAKAGVSHTHTISNVTGLQAALDAKSNNGHVHDDRYYTEGEIDIFLEDKPDRSELATKSDISHTHDSRYYTESEVDAFLANKSATNHTHTISNVTGLQAALDGKSSTSHGHIISNISGLQAALDAKSDAGHLHDDRYYTESEMDTKLAAKASSSHGHSIDQVTGLSLALNDKMDKGPMEILELIEQAASPATPGNGVAFIYTKGDGGLYMKSDLGIERSLLVADSALHANPDFEIGTGAIPTNWSNYWGTAGTWGYDTASAIQGIRSIYNDSVGISGNIRLGSDMFAVAGESTIEITVWSKADANTTLNVTFMTSTPEGNPDYFGGGLTTQSSVQAVTTAWTKITVSFVVPAGHTKARIYFNLTAGRRTWLDASGSRVSVPAPTPFGVITGEIKMWPTATAPTGYLLCNGGTFSSTTYPVLAALLGDLYGTHSGTTYYLPDFRGRSPIGVGSAGAGAGSGTLTLAQKYGHYQMQQHTHSASTGGSQSSANQGYQAVPEGVYGQNYGAQLGGGYTGRIMIWANTNEVVHTHTVTVANAGSGTAENLHPVLGVNFIIKAA